jgi:hypothetical protein
VSSNHLAARYLQGRGALDYHNSPSSKQTAYRLTPRSSIHELPRRGLLGNRAE